MLCPVLHPKFKGVYDSGVSLSPFYLLRLELSALTSRIRCHKAF